MRFSNWTDLRSEVLHDLFIGHTAPWRHDDLDVTVRYSRSADFSGTCFYRDSRIFVNLGRHNKYPYTLATHIARAQSNRTSWSRELYRLELRDGYQLALFIYLHELFHHLVYKAGRGVRQKEAMCDRFATRVLVDIHGCRLTDSGGRPADRGIWDFQDLEAFVARAPRQEPSREERIKQVPVVIHPIPGLVTSENSCASVSGNGDPDVRRAGRQVRQLRLFTDSA